MILINTKLEELNAFECKSYIIRVTVENFS